MARESCNRLITPTRSQAPPKEVWPTTPTSTLWTVTADTAQTACLSRCSQAASRPTTQPASNSQMATELALKMLSYPRNSKRRTEEWCKRTLPQTCKDNTTEASRATINHWILTKTESLLQTRLTLDSRPTLAWGTTTRWELAIWAETSRSVSKTRARDKMVQDQTP